MNKTAPSAFDPYHRWLGIPPSEQPAHHYRLLGIGLFEEDPEVIESASDRQMAHVRTFQTGRHAANSQRLLNELSAAKICLLDEVKRRDYDLRLRRRLENKGELPVARKSPEMAAFAVAISPSPSVARPIAVPRRKSSSAALAVFLGVVALAMLAALMFLLLN